MLAIKADYYLYGIETGIIHYDEAIEWADSIVEKTDEPLVEFIELALSKARGRNGVMESLNDIPGERNRVAAGKYLLGLLKQKLNAGASVKEISKKAMDIVSVTQQPADDYYSFDMIDDEISLAEEGTYGTMEQCTNDLKKVLSKYKAYNET